MKSRTKTESDSPVLHRCVVNLLGVTRALVSICVGLVLCHPVLEASALPGAEELLQELHLSDSDRQGIREGKIVTWSATEGSDRELALGMAMLAKTKPENLVALFREAAAFKHVSLITAFGKIEGAGTVADFAGVKLAPNGEKEARRYLEAKPGDELNLDGKEIAAFRALKAASKEGAVPIQKVEALIREGLLARYQAYHAKGLAGIAPYARTSGRQTFPSDELSIATRESPLVAKYLPSVFHALLNYPSIKLKEAEELEEQFYWVTIEVFGRPTYVLSHHLRFQIGEAIVLVDRHYYASHDYNALQQGAMALPAKDDTLVTFLSRVSTDQVAGFGSSVKHPVSRVLMAPYLKDLLEALRAKAEKQ
ncbi:MAG: hypothetical protein HXY51_12900 [Nitrospirae bacterium]|nr:hypothetical protein [Nitrospirota bacterium]